MVERLQERDEVGFIGAKRAMFIGAVLTASVVGTAASFMNPTVEASANLNQADTSVSFHKIVWDPHQAITPATVYFDETMQAQNIKENIVVRPFFGHGPDIMPDPTVNKELTGSGQEVFQLPFSAISQYPDSKTGKIDMSVDLSKVEGNISWWGAGPDIKDYTLDNGKKNFQDRSGFVNSLVHAAGSNLRVININTLGNTVDDLNAHINHDMKLKGLDAFGTCNKKPPLITKLESLSAQAIRANAAMMGRTDIGKINFTNTTTGFHVDTGQRAAQLTGDSYEHSYTLPSGNFHIDKLNCNLSKQEVVG